MGWTCGEEWELGRFTDVHDELECYQECRDAEFGRHFRFMEYVDSSSSISGSTCICNSHCNMTALEAGGAIYERECWQPSPRPTPVQTPQPSALPFPRPTPLPTPERRITFLL